MQRVSWRLREEREKTAELERIYQFWKRQFLKISWSLMKDIMNCSILFITSRNRLKFLCKCGLWEESNKLKNFRLEFKCSWSWWQKRTEMLPMVSYFIIFTSVRTRLNSKSLQRNFPKGHELVCSQISSCFPKKVWSCWIWAFLNLKQFNSSFLNVFKFEIN